MTTTTEVIKKLIETYLPLFEKAEKENLWFYSAYHDVWFSPAELRTEHENGKFLWSLKRWELKDSQTQLDNLEGTAELAQKNYDKFKKRLGQ